MPDGRTAGPAGAQRRIIERPRLGAEAALANAVSQRMAQIYSARGIESVDELDLTLGSLLLPTQLDGAARAAQLLADAVMAGRHIRFVGDFDAQKSGVARPCTRGCRREDGQL